MFLKLYLVGLILRIQDIRSSNPPLATGLCHANKYGAPHHRSLKPGLSWKYLNIDTL